MKLVIINTLSEDKIKSLKKAVPGAIVESYKSPKEAIPHVADADAIAMWGFQDAEPILAAGPNIRWVHSLSDGVERLLSPSMLSRPIPLTNSHGVHDRAVPAHPLALLLAWMRRCESLYLFRIQHLGFLLFHRRLDASNHHLLYHQDCAGTIVWITEWRGTVRRSGRRLRGGTERRASAHRIPAPRWCRRPSGPRRSATGLGA